jgi:hypothetical protein
VETSATSRMLDKRATAGPAFIVHFLKIRSQSNPIVKSLTYLYMEGFEAPRKSDAQKTLPSRRHEALWVFHHYRFLP